MFQDFYTKLSDKEKKIFFAAIGVVFFACLDSLLFRPFMSKLKAMDDDIRQKTNSIERDIRFLFYRDKILTEEKQFSIYETSELKTEEEIKASFLKTVELLASESQIKLIKLNPSEVEQKKGYVQYHANLECSGKLEDMITFLHKIDMTSELLRIAKFNIRGKKASAQEVDASIKISKIIIDPSSVSSDMAALNGEETAEMKTMAGAAAFPSGGGSPSQTGQGTGGGSQGGGQRDGGVYSRETVDGSGGGTGGGGDESGGNSGGGSGSGRDGGAAGGGSGGGGGATGGDPGDGSGGGDENYAGGDDGGTGRVIGESSDEVSGTGAGAGEGGGYGGGTGGVGGAGVSGGGNTTAQKQQQEQQQTSPLKEKTDLQKKFDSTKQGGRVQVKTIESLWNDFWAGLFGGKKKEQPQPQGTYDEEKLTPEDLEDDSSVWEKKFRR